MTGLILFAILVVLVTFLILLSIVVTKPLSISTGWKALICLVIVVGAFPLMLIDEIIAKYQIEALCKANGIESVDVSKARGKRVKLEVEDRRLIGVMTPGSESDWIYRDEKTNEILFQYKTYYSYGGWIIRMKFLGIERSGPMIFSGGCFTNYMVRDSIFAKNSITLIN